MHKTLAIFSPSKNAYSETFIHAHKNLPFNIRYYFGGYLPDSLEEARPLIQFSILEKIKFKFSKKFNLKEQALLFSLKREKVDCILAEYGPTACESLEVIKFLQIPLVVHFHGFDATNPETIGLYGVQYKKMFEYASAVVAVSGKMKKDLIALGCSEHKIIVTACGPNEVFLTVKPDYNKYQFIAVGRFIDIKAPFITIAAFKKVVEQEPNATLIMIGEGPLLFCCRNLAILLGLTNSIYFKGVLNPTEIREVMKESIAFLQHSITLEGGITEGSPVAVMEAQAAGLPVVASDNGGIPEIVVNNETGFLVKEHDVDVMSQSMLRILREPGLARKMGEAGRNRIVNNFTQKNHLQVLETLINKIVH